jgi:hypothetical protein
MADVFISYSRVDSDFVRKLHARLSDDKRNVWVDWEGIPPSAEWLAEIRSAIDAADTFVFIISPDSLHSEICRLEHEHAAQSNKRIVPVVARDVDPNTVPPNLAKLNWLFFRAEDDFDQAYGTLTRAVDTDLEWVQAHTRLLVRAREWERNGRDVSYVLAGSDLEVSEQWLVRARRLEPKPTDLQLDYLAASRVEETRRQRSQLRGFYLVAIVYGVLQSGISYFVVFEEISEEGLVALSPLWVLGVVFGGFGLTLGRNSLRRSIIATALAGIGLYAFFMLLWPSL